MTCPSCGLVPPSGARFCPACGAALAESCPQCGTELIPGARFCPGCGRARDTAASGLVPGVERKVISVVFCDLAGFTSHTEASDLEEVEERLGVYHARVREDTERFGGRVEKLMGDGVLAVFGAPVAHEDDSERAVRAALRIQRSVAELNGAAPELALGVRIAVTTGEAMVQLTENGDREGVVGDVVNTASRLQQEAGVGEVVVDARTHELSRHAISYQPRPPVRVRGKTGSVPIWRAVEPHGIAAAGAGSDDAAPFVGRAQELNLLLDTLDRAVAASSAQLVTVVGEAGVGKSRLIRELYRSLDRRPDLVWWRQGRCLPYGEGITFWALGEVVRTHAGILEAESPAQVTAKLEAAVAALVDDPGEAEWLRLRLAPLVGLPGSDADRTELFQAWRRFLELVALRGPLVLVIEDLHWASDAMLDFLAHLLDWSRRLPILVVATARPELFDRRPDWGGGRRDAVTLGLSPLTPDDTLALVGSLAAQVGLPDSAREALAEQSGGNPLYLTEFLRLVSERGAADVGSVPLPDTVQALIAARIDLLSVEDKGLLQAAAVMGKTFWAGALAFLRGVDTDRVRGALGRMAQRELIRPLARSSMVDEDEHAFNHVLVREVAYAQIPRRERAGLHEAVGRWLEAKAGDRLTDVAEHIAHHYATALGHRSDDDPELARRAYRFLMLSAQRLQSLDPVRAEESYRRAAELAREPAELGRALLGQSRVCFDDVEESLRLADAAITELARAGDREGEVEALTFKGFTFWYQGDAEAADRVVEEVVDRVEGMDPSQAVAEALVGVAAQRQLRGLEEEALDVVERALEVAQMVGSTEAFARALTIRGTAHLQRGRFDALEDVREGLRIFLDRNLTHRAMQAYNNLATFLIDIGRLSEGLEVIEESIEYGTSRGYVSHVDWSRNTRCEALFPLGRWDEVLETTEHLLAVDAERGGSQISALANYWKAAVLHQRGRPGPARAAWEASMAVARSVKDPQAFLPPLALGVTLLWETGEVSQAHQLADELAELVDEHRLYGALYLPTAAPTLVAMGRTSELAELAGKVITGEAELLEAWVDWIQGLVADAAGDPAELLAGATRLIEVCDATGNRFWGTAARIDAARAARALGQTDEADRLASEARSIASELGAKRLLALLDG